MCASAHSNKRLLKYETQLNKQRRNVNVENHNRPREQDTHRDDSYETNKA